MFESKNSIRKLLNEGDSTEQLSLEYLNLMIRRPFPQIISEFWILKAEKVKELEKKTRKDQENAIYLEITNRLDALESARQEAEGIIDTNRNTGKDKSLSTRTPSLTACCIECEGCSKKLVRIVTF